MDKAELLALKRQACRIRMHVIEGTFNARSGHPGGSLSIADTLSYLYFKALNIDPENPSKADRDRLVLSKGHCAPALYGALAERGYFGIGEIKKLRKVGAMLQGHPDMKGTPGVDMSTGSLGQGISAACGMALSAKISDMDYKVYSIMGDGELQEGEAWEAFMFASHYKLDNLIVFVDLNGLQIDGSVSEVMSLGDISAKFKAFGWNVYEIDAHDFDEIDKAVSDAVKSQDKPNVILQKSVKGKGVSFMENNVSWHGSAPNEEQYKQAMDELETELKNLEG